MTQLSEALEGNITPAMEQVAQQEGIRPEQVRQGLAEGTLVIPCNKRHTGMKPTGIGAGLRTKVSASVGLHGPGAPVAAELEKIKAAVDAGTDAIMDLSVSADLDTSYEGKVLPCKVGYGTRNMTKGPAMTREQAVMALERGVESAGQLLNQGLELLATGDMGIGNTTPSSAILAAISGRPARDVTGRGTGITDDALENKIRVIERALQVNGPNPKDAVDVLSKVGGFEIGGIAGLILGAAFHRIPVVVDGFISSAGALLAKTLAPASVDYMIAGHQSLEHGHEFMLKELGLKPLLNLNLRLGEGTGAALAMNLVEAAAQVMSKMLTFEEAGVTRRPKGVEHDAVALS